MDSLAVYIATAHAPSLGTACALSLRSHHRWWRRFPDTPRQHFCVGGVSVTVSRPPTLVAIPLLYAPRPPWVVASQRS